MEWHRAHISGFGRVIGRRAEAMIALDCENAAVEPSSAATGSSSNNMLSSTTLAARIGY